MHRFVLIYLALTMFLPSAGARSQRSDDTLSGLLARLQRRSVSVRSAVDLWRLEDLWDLANQEQRHRARKVLHRIVQNRKAPLALSRQARRMLGRLEQAAGHKQEFLASFDRLGTIRDWWIVGPFDNDGHRGYDTQYPPEASIVLDRTEEGSVRPVHWRLAPVRPADGRMLLHPVFLPQEKSVAYALCVLSNPRPVRALVHAGCDDGCRIWINHSMVVDDPGPHPMGYDQQVVALTLPRGDNQVLIKVAQNSGAWGFTLSITDPGGRPLPGLRVVSDREQLKGILAKPPPGPPGKLAPVDTLASWFVRRAESAPQDPEALAEAALALMRTGAHDVRQRRVDELVTGASQAIRERHPRAYQTLLLLAETTDDGNLARNLLQRAVNLRPALPQALGRLGLDYQIRNQIEKSLKAHVQALATRPGYLPSELGRAELLHALGLTGQSVQALERLYLRHPDVPEVLIVSGNLYRRMGRPRLARERFEQAVKIRADHQLALRALFEMAAARGDLDASLGWMDRLLDLDPLRVDWWIEKGDLFLHNQRTADALASYRRAVAICPHNPVALAREGLGFQALGQTAQCLQRWTTAHDLSPQDSDLARHIDSLRPPREAFYQPWAQDAIAHLDLSAHPTRDEANGALRLLDLTVVKLLPNGMTSRYRQQIIKVLSARGAEHVRSHRVEYAPSRQHLRILTSRVIRPDRSTDKSVLVDDYSLSEPWYNLYYDVHAREITFPVLREGDVIELIYQLDDVGDHTLLGNYFGDLVPFQFAEPVNRITYVLLTPPDTRLHHHVPPWAQHRSTSDDEGMVRVWEAQDVPAVEPEPDMPGFTESYAFLHVSSFEDWSDLAGWYRDQVADQLVAGPEVKRLAASLVEGKPRAEDKVRALYRFVADSTRYVGLEFGIHSYVPYPTSQVLQRKFGDCKDKSSLLVAMLREVGIPAQLALVRMRHLGSIPPAPASLAVFNHAVVHLPEHGLWLDATASHHDTRDLPTQDQDVPALLITEEGGRLTRTSSTTSDHNRTEIGFRVRPSPDGTASVEARVVVTGGVAPAMRSQLSSSTTREAVIEKIMNKLFPGAEVSSLAVDNLNRPDLPLEIATRMTVPVMARSEDNAIDVPVLGRGTTYQKIFSPFQNRRFDLVLAPPLSVSWSVAYFPPEDHHPLRLPAGGQVASTFGRAEMQCKNEPDHVRIDAKFSLDRKRVPAVEYKAFRDFLGQVDRMFSTRLRFVRSQGAGS